MSNNHDNHVPAPSDPYPFPVPSSNGNVADKLTGLVGIWRQLANFGLVGLLSGLLLFLVYEQRQDIETFKTDARSAHADVGRLTQELSANRAAIDKLTTAVDALSRELRRERALRCPE